MKTLYRSLPDMKIIFKLGYLVSIALLFALTNADITMAAVIVLMMTIPGVALFYAGMVR